ncbi:transposable element Tcb2 transposase [Trichonephila clavipes]|uniref:Transposable element Tcb2 transposase n=1 Tax=Trichonephila clavipes TaxID=2585209 RepID=A0A8X6WBC7_TRICX|nr:transposable element Tcb2 transposase [Trichonephila clavipes]
MMETGWSARPVARQVGRSNLTVRSDESRFNLSSNDNRVRVWRPHGERFNATFALQRHTTPTAGVMVMGAIVYDTRPSLILIHDTLAAQWYFHDIRQPHVLPLLVGLSGAIFQQDNAQSHTKRMSQVCLRHTTTFPWPSRSPDLSPIEHILAHLRRGVGQPTSWVVEARLQQVGNEMSQDILRNLYASRAARIASCIRAKRVQILCCPQYNRPTVLCIACKSPKNETAPIQISAAPTPTELSE